MTADDDDDPKLQQLRAVWVSMRDEDPPDRGMAALMAAAREKAAEMTPRESWWHKVLVTLRRPPVLALATVTVLLGGALFMTQRKDKLDAVSVVDERADGERADEERNRVATPAAEPPASGSSTVIVPPSEPKPPEPELSAKGSKSAPQKPRPATKPNTGKAAETTKDVDSGGTFGGDAVTIPPAPPPPVMADNQEAPALQIAADDAPAPESPKKKAPIARKPLPPIEGDAPSGAPAGQAQQPTVAQLVKQCETAAAKGDCATVRTLAARIAKSDPATYKQRIANNAAITRCLQLDE